MLHLSSPWNLTITHLLLLLSLFLFNLSFISTTTDPGDLKIINDFKAGITNSDKLNWPENDNDPCGPPSWPHIFCTQSRISEIQIQGMGLKGELPSNLNQLSMLSNLGLQKNQFTGPLPTLNGLSKLRFAYFDYNLFDEMPFDFFHGLDSLQVLALDNIPINETTGGWSIPIDLRNSGQLQNLTLMSSNLVGELPEFLGTMGSLEVLKVSMNRISGGIPLSFNESGVKILWLNGQGGGGMTGNIDVIGSMSSLTSLWLHGNHFSGKIPENIGGLTELKEFNVNSNDLVGLVPDGLASLSLEKLDLNNNQFMGPVPKFKALNFSFSSNKFCRPDPGIPCAPEVNALLDFLNELNYPSRLVSSWSGNNPCDGPWFGVSCIGQKVSMIHLAKFNLSGTLSPSIANLESLTRIDLGSNKLTGVIPASWSKLKALTLLDLSNNDLSPPKPNFNPSMKIVLSGNPLFISNSTSAPSPKTGSPTGSPSDSHGSSVPTDTDTNPSTKNPSNIVSGGNGGDGGDAPVSARRSKKLNIVAIIAPVAVFACLVLLVVPLCIYLCKKKKVNSTQTQSSLVIHPRDPSDPDNAVKIAIANDTQTSLGSGSGESHVIESGNLIISVQVLRNVTKNFAHENELGRGGFGVVYKGQLDDGTKIAVKRMESGVISNKALDEFQAEIAVLSKVRHRHLVSLLGYSTEGPERILVYEYMPQGALSRHLFHWKNFKLEPLSWKRRLNIALDVARGMEYLHTLGHQSFIHRDLKSSNILLGDDYRAKVSDFGLVKLAPDGEKSVITRLAGTFGYLAPEYAVTGKITTKADVFSYGVVLMELLTGLMALDEDRPEESQYLAAWFWSIRSNKEKLMAAVDPALNANEETFETISVIAELAGHCTAREPGQRPEMGHAVNVLSPLVEKWKPRENEAEDYCGIDYSLPLTQMVKGWQEAEGKDYSSYVDLDDSKSSIPARPTGFADSFTSADGR